MLIESTVHLPVSLAMFQSLFHAPDGDALLRIGFRWFHFVAGVTWIGLLYFFNLVNVPVMKALDGPTKGKVIPQLLPRTAARLAIAGRQTLNDACAAVKERA